MEMGGHMMEPMVLGLSLDVFLMIASGVFYLICAAFVLKPMRREKNELINALFAFLIYQAVSMFFMGLEMETMNMLYGNIAALSVFVGSAYMLKFPLSSLSKSARNISFMAVLIIALGVFIWFMQTEARQMSLMGFVLWYDLVLNGIIVGGSILGYGFKVTERFAKTKALAGGSGVISCCVVSNVAMIGGAFVLSSVFQFLAPILILGALAFARKKSPSTPAGPTPFASSGVVNQ